MKKGLKKLVIFGGLMLAGITVYRKVKNSEEENLAKAVSKTIKDKVDETMKEADVKDMIDKNVYEYLLWMKERDDAARDHEDTETVGQQQENE